MQTGAFRARIPPRLYWAFFLSIVIHGGVAALVLTHHPVFHAGAPEEIVSVATLLNVTRRQPPVRTKPVRPRQLFAQPKPQHRSIAQPAPPRRELARITPSAPVAQPPPAPVHSHVVAAAVQQVDFEKTIERLRRENDPIVSAERPVQRSDLNRTFALDVGRSAGSAPRGEGILTPEKAWQADGYDYYYVRYWVQYPDGSTETGIVPWPLRYLPEDDPFRLHILHFPLPGPLADFALPPGTPLHPLIAYCYAHRGELASCPIHHD